MEASLYNDYEHKSPAEIKEIIQKYLVSNEILGYLNDNLLYMKSFGKDSSLDKYFFFISFVVFLSGLEFFEYFIRYWILFLTIGIGSLVIGLVLNKLLKFYLVFDINREVFYTITIINKVTVYKTDEIRRTDIIELGVDVLDKNPADEKQLNSDVLHFKGDIMDNPGLRSSLIGLKPDGTKVFISDPMALRQPHEAAVARCKLFAECLGMNAVICNKNEGILVIKEGNQIKLSKYNREKEWADGKIKYTKNMYYTFAFLIAIFVGCYFLGKFID